MNTTVIGIIGLAWWLFAYLWYSRVIDRRVVQPNDQQATPSEQINDNLDFVPTSPLVLFGHHFSSIAGAGPIVGPILAFSLFGWLPALLWILIGSAFIGAVHDYTSLMVSLRNRGVSIVEIAGRSVSKTARWIFSVFVWFALVLVQPVFAVLTAQTLTEKPEIVIPTIGTFLPALFMNVTTQAALIYLLGWEFIPQGKWALSMMAVFLMLLGLLVTYEVFRKFRLTYNRAKTNPADSPTLT